MSMTATRRFRPLQKRQQLAKGETLYEIKRGFRWGDVKKVKSCVTFNHTKHGTRENEKKL